MRRKRRVRKRRRRTKKRRRGEREGGGEKNPMPMAGPSEMVLAEVCLSQNGVQVAVLNDSYPTSQNSAAFLFLFLFL